MKKFALGSIDYIIEAIEAFNNKLCHSIAPSGIAATGIAARVASCT